MFNLPTKLKMTMIINKMISGTQKRITGDGLFPHFSNMELYAKDGGGHCPDFASTWLNWSSLVASSARDRASASTKINKVFI